jgi:serine/threonine protein kinase
MAEPSEGELILYQAAAGAVRVEVLYEAGTFWLTQNRIADLFGVELPTVSYHLKEIYDSGELRPEGTFRKNWIVQTEGNREIDFYNLDAIISVGYRVNSVQATQFRIWAMQTLLEFIAKGFVLDDERLSLNQRFVTDTTQFWTPGPLAASKPSQSRSDTAQEGNISKPAQLEIDSNTRDVFSDLSNSEKGKYSNFTLAGAGGMGVVVAAYQDNIAKWVALKVSRFDTDSDLGRKFYEEAQHMVHLKEVQNAHVPEISDAGLTLRKRPYFRMELLRGPTLRRLAEHAHSQMEPSPEWRRGLRREMLEHLCDALECLQDVHAHGFIHRDLKPDNLKLTADLDSARSFRRVMIIDWGMYRKYTGDGTAHVPGVVVGTLDFMSPEQSRGDSPEVDPRTDIYSMGSTLFWLLSGRGPLCKQPTKQMKLTALWQLNEEAFMSIEEAAPNTPSELKSIVRRALQFKPDERYASAGAMAKDLRAFLSRSYVRAYADRLSLPSRVPYYVGVGAAQGSNWVMNHRIASASATLVVASAIVGGFEYNR